MSVLDHIRPIQAAALSDEDKEALYRETQSFRDKSALMDQAALRVGKLIGGTGAAIGVLGMICAATLFPLKQREVEYFIVDQARGYVGPAASATDAPRLFDRQVMESDVLKYVEAREDYQYETDGLAFHLVTIMSAPDEQQRYKEMHDAKNAPAKALGDRGYVRIDHIQMWPIGDGKRQSHEYVVKFTRRQVISGQPIPLQGNPYTAEITFELHPEYLMGREDRRRNPTGFQAINYIVHADGEKSR
jgi:type IV secretion system protein VirB8